MYAGFVIFYTSERGLIKKLDGVALLIPEPPPTSFSFVQKSMIKIVTHDRYGR